MYKKTQISWLFISVFSFILADINISYFYHLDSKQLPFKIYVLLTVFFILMMLLFFRLTIKVEKERIHIIYGIGLIHIKVRPSLIDKVRITRFPWYYGFGIRKTSRGMLYNVQGLNAVEISYVNINKASKTVLIGSPEAEKLQAAILKNFKS